MLTCPACLFKFKKNEAIKEKGALYCSVACRLAGRQGLYWHVSTGFEKFPPSTIPLHK